MTGVFNLVVIAMPPIRNQPKPAGAKATNPLSSAKEIKHRQDIYNASYKRMIELRINITDPKGSGTKFPNPSKFKMLPEAQQKKLVLLIDASVALIELEIKKLVSSFKNQEKILKKYKIPYDPNEFNKMKHEEKQEMIDELEEKAKNLEIAKKKIVSIFDHYLDEAGSAHTEGVAISNSQALIPVNVNSEVYKELQRIGAKKGCWECGAKIDDKDSWIADHIPPFNLKKSKLVPLAAQLGEAIPGNFTLYPSCKDCSSEQSSLVRKVNTIAGYWNGIKKGSLEHQQLFGGKFLNNGVKATGRSTKNAHDTWQGAKGLRCHLCGDKKSHTKNSSYIADHYPPREFNTNYATTLFSRVGLKLPAPEVRPQCTSCSSKQGGSLSKDAEKLQQYADLFGITSYK